MARRSSSGYAYIENSIMEEDSSPRTFIELGFSETLPIQLIPQPTWGINVRSKLRPEDWKRLRREARESHPPTCGGCRKPLADSSWHAHEVWRFDDQKLTQRLIDIVPVCPQCHHAIHIGRAHATGTFEQAVEHLRIVNFMNDSELETYLTLHFALWQRRSSKGPWTVDITYAQDLLDDLNRKDYDYRT